ncbi:hypothetical protein [Streptomyces lushanensis]|uniref:hypothetical protein n=1 Tax=Streptomyces lushanensis TaxID=1434255 RepID=UPI00083242B3|nr:hypothetical protein [Streptomyces lushanensis]
MITLQDVREAAQPLPRTEEHLIREYIKFKVGRIVYATVSPDETTLGFAFPKEERDLLIASAPGTFQLPRASDLRYNWVELRMAAVIAGSAASASPPSARGSRPRETLGRGSPAERRNEPAAAGRRVVTPP